MAIQKVYKYKLSDGLFSGATLLDPENYGIIHGYGITVVPLMQAATGENPEFFAFFNQETNEWRYEDNPDYQPPVEE